MENILLEFTTQFFTNIGIQFSSLKTEMNDLDIHITLETPDSHLIIGTHGKNLELFEHILGRIYEKKFGKFSRVHLEVNNYVAQKDERFYRFLDSKVAFVCATGKSVQIPNLNSYDRKKAHNYISEKKQEGLKTESSGEGASRVLILSYTGNLIPQSNTIHSHPTTIDLSEDGIGI